MNSKSNTPPILFLRLFRWYCHPKLVKHIEGDLLEVYQGRSKFSNPDTNPVFFNSNNGTMLKVHNVFFKNLLTDLSALKCGEIYNAGKSSIRSWLTSLCAYSR